MTFGQQACVCEGFGHAPVDRLFAGCHGFTRFDHTFCSRMQGKAFRYSGEFLGKTLDVGGRQTGFDFFAPIFALVFAPVDLCALEVAQSCLFNMFAFIQSITVGLDVTVSLSLGNHAFGNQLLGVQSTRTRVLRYFFVHHRLGQGRIIALVVAPFTVADNVDYDVFMEFFAVIQSGLDGKANAFRVIAVHVDNRSGNHFRDIGTVYGRTGIAGIGSGKADLVVDHDMNGTAGGIAACFRQVECCLVNTQTDKCGVTVNQYRQNFIAAVFAQTFLFGARRTFHYWVNNFQV